MFAKEPSIPRRWPLYRGLRVIFCQCCDWLYFFFIAVIFFFLASCGRPGINSFFFCVPAVGQGAASPGLLGSFLGC